MCVYQLSASKNPGFIAANSKAGNWTRFWATSIHFPFLQPISVRSNLTLSFHLLCYPSALLQKASPPKCCMHSSSPHPSYNVLTHFWLQDFTVLKILDVD